MERNKINLRKELLRGNKSLAIWGGGFIGYNTAAFFAKHGVSSLIIEIDEKKIQTINNGHPPYPEIEAWLGFNVTPFSKLIHATNDWKQALSPTIIGDRS